MVLAAFCWGLSGGIGGLLLQQGWEASVISFYRGAMGLFFVLIWLMIRSRDGGWMNIRLWGWSLAAGLGISGNFTFYFISVAEGSVAMAVTLMYSAPVFVFLASFVLGVERPSWRKGFGIALVLCGLMLLTGAYRLEHLGITPWGAGAGVLSGMSYALFIFAFKNASHHGSPQAVLSLAFTVVVCLLMIPAEPGELLKVLDSSDKSLFILLGLLGGGISFYMYIVGLRNTLPSTASIAAMVEPVTASLFGITVLNEHLGIPQWIGMIIVLVTVTALSSKTDS